MQVERVAQDSVGYPISSREGVDKETRRVGALAAANLLKMRDGIEVYPGDHYFTIKYSTYEAKFPNPYGAARPYAVKIDDEYFVAASESEIRLYSVIGGLQETLVPRNARKGEYTLLGYQRLEDGRFRAHLSGRVKMEILEPQNCKTSVPNPNCYSPSICPLLDDKVVIVAGNRLFIDDPKSETREEIDHPHAGSAHAIIIQQVIQQSDQSLLVTCSEQENTEVVYRLTYPITGSECEWSVMTNGQTESVLKSQKRMSPMLDHATPPQSRNHCQTIIRLVGVAALVAFGAFTTEIYRRY